MVAENKSTPGKSGSQAGPASAPAAPAEPAQSAVPGPKEPVAVAAVVVSGPKLTAYKVLVSQLNRIDPVTKEFAPVPKGRTVDLDPDAADTKRWVGAGCIAAVGGETPQTVAQKAADPAVPAVSPNPAQGPNPDPAASAQNAASEGSGVAGAEGTPIGDGGKGVPVT